MGSSKATNPQYEIILKVFLGEIEDGKDISKLTDPGLVSSMELKNN